MNNCMSRQEWDHMSRFGHLALPGRVKGDFSAFQRPFNRFEAGFGRQSIVFYSFNNFCNLQGVQQCEFSWVLLDV